MSEHIVLCVDDETNILQALKRLLRKEPYRLCLANSGKTALEQLAREPAHVIISDQRMPEMTGVEFLQEVKNRYPGTVRVILSGYADVATIVDAINKGEVFRFFAKPWNDDELRLGIRQCLEHYELVEQNRHLLRQVQEQNEELQRVNAALDALVASRTTLLQSEQQIFAELPLPIAGISADGLIVMANTAVSRMFPSRNFGLGTESREALAPTELAAVEKCLSSGESINTVLPLGNARSTKFSAIPLKHTGKIAGCIAIWMEADHAG